MQRLPIQTESLQGARDKRSLRNLSLQAWMLLRTCPRYDDSAIPIDDFLQLVNTIGRRTGLRKQFESTCIANLVIVHDATPEISTGAT
jgi:hypothetical protein